MSASRSIVLAVDGAVAEDGDDECVASRQADDLHRSHGGQFCTRAHDDRSVLGDLREEVGGLVKELFEPTMGSIEERSDPLRRGRIEAPGGRDVVDEESISLVGRHTTGGGVRLGQVALLLEHRHLVANGGGADSNAGQIGDVRRPHRLSRGDVLLHDGPEYGGLAFIEHLALQVSEC